MGNIKVSLKFRLPRSLGDGSWGGGDGGLQRDCAARRVEPELGVTVGLFHPEEDRRSTSQNQLEAPKHGVDGSS